MNKLTRRTAPSVLTLTRWRERQGLSTYEAAELLGISQSTYSRTERGKQHLRGRLAKQVSERTGVPVAVLVGAN